MKMLQPLFVFLIISILAFSAIGIADSENGNSGDSNDDDLDDSDDDNFDDDEEDDNDSDDDDSESEVEIEEESENGKIKKKIKVKNNGEEIEIETELEVESEGEDGEVKLKVKNKEIKVMPEKASKIALEELGTEDIEIRLEEDGGDVFYTAESEKEGRVLGVFKKKVKIKVEIDSETGEVILKKKPWWAFFVSGEEDFQLGDNVVLCHLPPGNPENGQTITVGSPAIRAHLAHGDYLGACEGEDDGNQTDDNSTMMNLTLSIISPMNTTYNFTDILVEIDSNGEVRFSINNGTEEMYNGTVMKTFAEGDNTLSATATRDDETLMEEVIFEVDLSNSTEIPVNETVN